MAGFTTPWRKAKPGHRRKARHSARHSNHPFLFNVSRDTRRGRANLASGFTELAAVKNQRPIAAEEEHRVLQFRPRNPALKPGWRQDLGPQARQEDVRPEPNDLSRYERPRDEPDDFRHRMLANIAAFAFTVALTAIGIWLAMSIADLRRTQDCVLMGRRDCVRISAPSI
jgi:hypothetical protein